MSRWSKLKKDVENIMAQEIDFKIYANAYRFGDSIPIPRFWITIKGDIIWDWPKNFIDGNWYFYDSAKAISQLLRDYINTPESQLLNNVFEDPFNLIPILRVCDRRIGKRRLKRILDDPQSSEMTSLILKRLNNVKTL